MTRLRVALAVASALLVALSIVSAHPQAQGSAPAGATLRTPWGDPDIQGLFTTDDELGVPFERPEQFSGRDAVNDNEFADRQAQAARQAPAAPLSGREIEVARTIARGRTNQEIAAELVISLSTVKTHVAAIQAKLGVRNRVEIAAWAWESRLVGGAGA